MFSELLRMYQSTAGYLQADLEDSRNRKGPARSEGRPLRVARGPEKLNQKGPTFFQMKMVIMQNLFGSQVMYHPNPN